MIRYKTPAALNAWKEKATALLNETHASFIQIRKSHKIYCLLFLIISKAKQPELQQTGQQERR